MLTRKEELKKQRKEINRSFAKQISKKDKRINELEKDLKVHQSAVVDMMDEQPDTNRAVLIEQALCSQHKLKPPA